MKRKNILMITLLAVGAIVMSACQPVTPVASTVDSEAAPESVDATESVDESPATGYGSGPGTASAECDGTGQQQGGGGHGHNGEAGGQAPAFAIGELRDIDTEGLAFMREEEKLARDVYLTLYDQWGLQPFTNIASSEQTHTDLVKALLEMYELPDPVVDESIGVFVNADLQALYDQLIEKGSTSLVDALEVGIAIEEIDILDLIDYTEATEEANIEWVYDNLKAGSENHLRAFVSQWEMQTGETYVPQYLTQEMYDAIMSASNGNGGGHGQGGHGQGGGGRTNNN